MVEGVHEKLVKCWLMPEFRERKFDRVNVRVNRIFCETGHRLSDKRFNKWLELVAEGAHRVFDHATGLLNQVVIVCEVGQYHVVKERPQLSENLLVWIFDVH